MADYNAQTAQRVRAAYSQRFNADTIRDSFANTAAIEVSAQQAAAEQDFVQDPLGEQQTLDVSVVLANVGGQLLDEEGVAAYGLNPDEDMQIYVFEDDGSLLKVDGDGIAPVLFDDEQEISFGGDVQDLSDSPELVDHLDEEYYMDR